jgi:hypothetical protein
MTQPLGKFLNFGLGIYARSAHYAEEGKWYATLGPFPGVLFDPQGYILFETREDYLRVLEPYISDRINIPRGISHLPGYRRLTETGHLFSFYNKMFDIQQKSELTICNKWEMKNGLDAPKAIDLPRGYHKDKHTLNLSYRLIRETMVSRWVKYIHKYRCQVCGETVVLGKSDQYAETHHLQPPGRPHNGPDVFENVICVCPQHHVQLDYRVLLLEEKQLNKIPEHKIADKYIEYSNSLVAESPLY